MHARNMPLGRVRRTTQADPFRPETDINKKEAQAARKRLEHLLKASICERTKRHYRTESPMYHRESTEIVVTVMIPGGCLAEQSQDLLKTNEASRGGTALNPIKSQ